MPLYSATKKNGIYNYYKNNITQNPCNFNASDPQGDSGFHRFKK